MLISFIVPAFNASSYIGCCLDSIMALKPDISDFEVIVVDDASEDNTVEIVKEYAIKYQQIQLLYQTENHRQGATRNRGVYVAKGRFIVFVDSDDQTAKGVIDSVRLAEKKEADMIAFRFVKVGVNGGTEKISSLPYSSEMVFSGKELQTEFPYWNSAPWSYVYRKSFLEKVNYPFAEDVL